MLPTPAQLVSLFEMEFIIAGSSRLSHPYIQIYTSVWVSLMSSTPLRALLFVTHKLKMTDKRRSRLAMMLQDCFLRINRIRNSDPRPRSFSHCLHSHGNRTIATQTFPTEKRDRIKLTRSVDFQPSSLVHRCCCLTKTTRGKKTTWTGCASPVVCFVHFSRQR